jgi:hypothetical protein
MASAIAMTPPNALPSLPDTILRTWFSQGWGRDLGLWNLYASASTPSTPAAAHAPATRAPVARVPVARAHVPPSVRAPQSRAQAAAQAPARKPGKIGVRFVNMPDARVSTRATGTAFHLDTSKGTKSDSAASWAKRFSNGGAPLPVDDGTVCRVPDIYAHAAGNPLLDSTGFGGNNLKGLPQVPPGPAGRKITVRPAAPKPKLPPIQRAVPVAAPVQDHPSWLGNIWHGVEFGAGMLWGFAKETVSTAVDVAGAAVNLTVGAPIALVSDIIGEEPPSYIPNANRVLRPLGALAKLGWQYATSGHAHPLTDLKNWAWNGIQQDVIDKWNRGEYFGAGENVGAFTSDVVTTVATIPEGGEAAVVNVLRASRLAVNAMRAAKAAKKLSRLAKDVKDVPHPHEPPHETAPKSPAEPSEPQVKSGDAEHPTTPSKPEKPASPKDAPHDPDSHEAKWDKLHKEVEEKFKTPDEIPPRHPKRPFRVLSSESRKISEYEAETLKRLQEKFPELDFKKAKHEGSEYVDKSNRHFDQEGGGPEAAKRFGDGKSYFESIRKHLVKVNHYTVLDLTYYSPKQIAAIKKHILSLPAEDQVKLYVIGDK